MTLAPAPQCDGKHVVVGYLEVGALPLPLSLAAFIPRSSISKHHTDTHGYLEVGALPLPLSLSAPLAAPPWCGLPAHEVLVFGCL